MQQYASVKAQYPDAILLFRVGDFYETFGEDAVTAARVLGIIQTKRNNGGSDVPLAGFPHHSLDMYLPRLVRAGYRVAICEQLEKPSPQKKIVKRGVTDVITPGVATGDKMLEHDSNNYLAAVAFGKRGRMGVSFLDISTGEFLVSEGDAAYLDKLFQSFAPSEVIFSKGREEEFAQHFGDRLYTYPIDEWAFTEDYTQEQLLNHFQTQSLKGFGIAQMSLAQVAAGATLHYLSATEQHQRKHISRIARIQPDRYVWLDRFTIRNLELVHSQHESGTPLFRILDKTVSPMGARLLKKWVVLPLKSSQAVSARHEAVGHLHGDIDLNDTLEQYIRQVGDLERLISKVSLGRITPREVMQLRRALGALQPIKSALEGVPATMLAQIGDTINTCDLLRERIARELTEDPPVRVEKGNVMQAGVSEELDGYRDIVANSKQLLLDIQQREAERTGITSLKIGFNNVFGYYLEVTNKYKKDAPPEWTRKQTLTNSERYITEELKVLETKILTAEENIQGLEERLFEELVTGIAEYIRPVQHNAALIGQLDCLSAFAKVALQYRYVRPEMNDGYGIEIEEGRHPVIERLLPPGEQYVSNDVRLDTESQQIMMITGPNMSGKSALLRQTALICLMAQMGSFVPARAARIGMIDKVFVRVGASDNISSGESTFMMEMNETASIMNNISDRSLVLLDEIGRGTSTYDGISIARSIAEYLHTNGQARPKTLFATHYHELNELADRFERIQNYHVSTRKVGQQVIFLRKLTPGGSEHSFGIHVARMAGMPRSIVERAAHILSQLEAQRVDRDLDGEGTAATDAPETAQPREVLQRVDAPAMQLNIFEQQDAVGQALKNQVELLDLNSMTPIECMMKLNELKKMLE